MEVLRNLICRWLWSLLLVTHVSAYTLRRRRRDQKYRLSRRQLVSNRCRVANNDKRVGKFSLRGIRSIHGTEENENAAAGAKLLRLAPANYSDGVSGMREGPDPRHTSNAIFHQAGAIPNKYRLTDMFWLWGQFLDHDMSLTHHNEANGFLFLRITDELLRPGMNFTRSFFHPETGDNTPREQINDITGFIDASMIYGSTKTEADSLRTLKQGRMKVKCHRQGDMLPLDQATKMFQAGDERVNEHLGLVAMHTLFVREHNRLCDVIRRKYARRDPSDEDIYQLARKLVGAIVQHITYNEFLPLLLGDDALEEYKGFDNTVNPAISNEFSTTAFGHTMLSSELKMMGSMDIMVASSSIPLRDAFFQPQLVLSEPSIVDHLLYGLSESRAQHIDCKVVDAVRNFLFGNLHPGGMDLVTLNIQRGRDHGMPTYNQMRKSMGLSEVSDWREVTSDEELQKGLASLYGSPGDMDLWVACLAEDHVQGASVGPLAIAIFANQFTRLRDGDPYHYKIDPDLKNFCDIVDLEEVTLSRIIQRNTRFKRIRDDVLRLPELSFGNDV